MARLVDMGDIVDINDQARAAATDASKQGKFNFIDRVVGRNYPTDEVVIYLDEAAGYKLAQVESELDEVRNRVKLFKGNAKDPVATELRNEIAQLESQRDAIREDAAKSRFVLHLEGISTKSYDETVDAAKDAYPYEYRETRNPLTFAIEREVIQSDERDAFFRYQLWAKFIRRVVDADGNEDSNITPAWTAQVVEYLPIMAQLRIQTGIEKLRMTTDWMDQIQGEDFLVKS